ncbi:MAG TPA: tetratricopeptide repeat protein, partial [Candidatus Udaeobacter sp.]|nr:tetratricopeptide repeat protein [Candidatus Udaeobacter sp.]
MKTRKYITAIIVAILGLSGFGPDASAQTMPTDNQITYYQQWLKRNPRNSRAYYALGDALIRKARETGDPGYFSR